MEEKKSEKVEKLQYEKEKKLPIFQQKEGNVRVQVYKNVNKRGVKYITYKIWVYKFPFKYNRNISLNRVEFANIVKLGQTIPIFEVDENDRIEKKPKK